VAIAMFLVVRLINLLKREAPKDAPLTKQEELLTEIRDLLREPKLSSGTRP
jgi:large-conductance mechanosensitive channel